MRWKALMYLGPCSLGALEALSISQRSEVIFKGTELATSVYNFSQRIISAPQSYLWQNTTWVYCVLNHVNS